MCFVKGITYNAYQKYKGSFNDVHHPHSVGGGVCGCLGKSFAVFNHTSFVCSHAKQTEDICVTDSCKKSKVPPTVSRVCTPGRIFPCRFTLSREYPSWGAHDYPTCQKPCHNRTTHRSNRHIYRSWVRTQHLAYVIFADLIWINLGRTFLRFS